jgi:2-oxoglutarate ferredoxin oxidoreductase subunit alpha
MKCSGLRDDTVSVGVGGEAGQGISRSGMLLGKALMRCGFHCYGAVDYPSLIRGGHNFYQLRASARPVYSQTPHVDVLVALNKESVTLHLGELNVGGGVIHDEGDRLEEGLGKDREIKFYPVPLTDIVKELGGPDIMRNTVALGAASALIGLDVEVLKQVVAETFEGRENIIKMNNDAVQKGHDHVAERGYEFGCCLEAGERPGRLWLTGNDAVALGAMAAGCKFYSAYPMTPASPLLHYFAGHDKAEDVAVIQTESEIAAAMMAIGASYAGVRSMTGTSGGGFSLMTESLSLAAMAETPLVIMLGQRPGPSTGLATYSAQGDLLFAVYGAHGEFQRIVVAPGDAEECFYLAAEAFNLAERFQVPVILLTDKNIVESNQTIDMFDLSKVRINRGKLVERWDGPGEYWRYRDEEDGVSIRALPGTEGTLVPANSNEHLENGLSTSRSEDAVRMVDKRFKKAGHIREAVEGLQPIRVYGDERPWVTMVGWGSTKGPALEALRLLKAEGIKARFVQVVFMEPFPGDLERYLKGTCVLIEDNRSAQLGTLIKLNTGYSFEHVGLRYDGRPFDPAEIVDRVMEAIA